MKFKKKKKNWVEKLKQFYVAKKKAKFSCYLKMIALKNEEVHHDNNSLIRHFEEV
jgi:hypothetical protein